MKKRNSAALVTLFSTLCIFSSSSNAADEKDFTMCVGGPSITAQQQIDGCTNLIKSGDLPKEHMAVAFNNRAGVYLQQERYREALSGYNDALEMNPAFFMSLLGKSSAQTELGDAENAMFYANEALKVAKPDQLGEVYNQRCWINAIDGQRLNDAMDDCNISLKHNANSAIAYDSRALVHFKLGNLKAALSDYQAGAKLDRKNPGFIYGMGVMEIRLGNRSEGNAHIAQAKALRADISDKYSRYGITAP